MLLVEMDTMTSKKRTNVYPGAAAQPRPPASAGFRPVNGASGKLNINGANTYQFVMSNPVGEVDPSGLATILLSLGGSAGTGVQPLAYPTPESVPIASTPATPLPGASPWSYPPLPPIPSQLPILAEFLMYEAIEELHEKMFPRIRPRCTSTPWKPGPAIKAASPELVRQEQEDIELGKQFGELKGHLVERFAATHNYERNRTPDFEITAAP